MSTFPFIAGTAQSWTIAASRTDLLAQQCRAGKLDLRNSRRARMYIAGGTAGLNTAIVSADWSPNGTDWTPFPIFLSAFVLGGSSVTQYSNWVEVPEGAQTENTRFRCMGEGGNGSSACTVSYLGIQFDEEAEYPANSLANTRIGRDYLFFGGSQIGGGGNAPDFGTVDPAIAAALNPLFVLGHAAGGITYKKNGTILTAIPTEHGAEIGFLWALWNAGGQTAALLSGTRIVCRFVDATTAATWVSTHFALLEADVAATAGFAGCVTCYTLGSTDANNDTTVANLDDRLFALGKRVAALSPGGAWVVAGQVTTDDVTYPKLTAARAVGQRRFSDTAREGRGAWIEWSGIELQPDIQHPTSDGEVDLGERFGAPVIAFEVHG